MHKQTGYWHQNQKIMWRKHLTVIFTSSFSFAIGWEWVRRVNFVFVFLFGCCFLTLSGNKNVQQQNKAKSHTHNLSFFHTLSAKVKTTGVINWSRNSGLFSDKPKLMKVTFLTTKVQLMSYEPIHGQGHLPMPYTLPQTIKLIASKSRVVCHVCVYFSSEFNHNLNM